MARTNLNIALDPVRQFFTCGETDDQIIIALVRAFDVGRQEIIRLERQRDDWRRRALDSESAQVAGVPANPEPQIHPCESPASRALFALMSSISERCYAAGWSNGLEFDLWGVMHGRSRNYGMDEVTEEEVEDMLWYATQVGGWARLRSDGSGGEIVPVDEWRKLYEQHQRAEERMDGP